MNYLANFLTGLSLTCGFISIIFSLEGHFTFASWAIILAAFFDGMDGQIARKNPIPSEFGKELDSLVDVVSFGIAPSILSYIFVYRHFYLWATLALFIYLACSVTRLAKYNITPKEKSVHYFSGLPTTGGGGILASFILIHIKYMRLPSQGAFLLVVLVLAFLMVSRLKYFNLDGLKEALGKLILPILVIVLIPFIFWPEITIFALFLIYVIFSPFLVRRIT